MTRTYDLWIDGAWSPAGGGRTIERRLLAHGETLAHFADGSKEDIDRAVTVARGAFQKRTWADLAGSRKSALIHAWAEPIARDVEKLAEIVAAGSGKPIRFARGEIAAAVEFTRYAAALAWQIKGDAYTNLGVGRAGLVTREPRGVVGIIVRWNVPLITQMQKLPFALAVGCTTVVKPSEMTSGTALEVAALATEAGIPEGVIDVVTGCGESAGEALSTHAEIDVISYTGPTRVGKRVARNQAERIGRVSLDLGGKGADVVNADADLDAALDGVLFGMLLNQGEDCCAGSRLIIERGVAEDFVARLASQTERVRVGLSFDESSDISALIPGRQMDSVLNHVAIGLQEGGRLVSGDARMLSNGLEKRSFVSPTIIDRVTPDNTLFGDDIFGPLTATTFEGVDEAVALANDTLNGLASGFWTKDIDMVHQVSRRPRNGTVDVNTFLEGAPQTPFGGFGEKSVGREMGIEAQLKFTEIKSNFIKLGAREPALLRTIA